MDVKFVMEIFGLEGYLSIDTFAKVSILYRYQVSWILPITNGWIGEKVTSAYTFECCSDFKSNHIYYEYFLSKLYILY